ncbi:MAG: YggS family pyridoxal phosphate-dependent enzyme [Acidobacteriota bacterium]
MSQFSEPPITMNDLERNLRSVQSRIHAAAEMAGRDPGEITLVAVSKTFPVEMILAAYGLGVRHIAENRVEEASRKIPQVRSQLSGESAGVIWHMVGHLQSRKVKDAATLFDFVQSVDSAALARRLEERSSALGKTLPVLLEINVSGEASKYGLASEPRENLFVIVDEVLRLPHLDVQGLMTMAPIVNVPDDARPVFRALCELRDELRTRFPGRAWKHLSMGMTDDFEIAIAEGATIVRIGRAIFGERPRP